MPRVWMRPSEVRNVGARSRDRRSSPVLVDLGVVLLAVALMLASRGAAAQVNVEPIRQKLSQDGTTFQFHQSVKVRTGNTEGVELGSGLLVGGTLQPSLVYLSASGDYSRKNETTDVAKSFAHLRYNYKLADWVAAEAFAQLETDRFRRLRVRTLFGLGPRFILLSNRTINLAWGTAAMLEITQRNDAVPRADRDNTAMRWSNYVAVSLQPHRRISVGQTLYYQPRFSDFSDYWLLNVTSLVFEVTDIVASRIDVTLRQEAAVPPNVERLDSEVISSLQLSF